MQHPSETGTLYIYWQDLEVVDKHQVCCWYIDASHTKQSGYDDLETLQKKFPTARLVLVLSCLQVRYHHIAMVNTKQRQQLLARPYLLQSEVAQPQEQLYIHWHQDAHGQTALFVDQGAWQTMLALFANMVWPLNTILVDAQLLPDTTDWVGLKWQQGGIFRRQQQLFSLQEEVIESFDPADIGMQIGSWLLPQPCKLNHFWQQWKDVDATEVTDTWLFAKLIEQHDRAAVINIAAKKPVAESYWLGVEKKWLATIAGFVLLTSLSLFAITLQWQQSVEEERHLHQYTQEWLKHYFPTQNFSSRPTQDLNRLLDSLPQNPQWPRLLLALDKYQINFVSPYQRLTGDTPILKSLAWNANQLQVQIQVQQSPQVETWLLSLVDIPFSRSLDDESIILSIPAPDR